MEAEPDPEKFEEFSIAGKMLLGCLAFEGITAGLSVAGIDSGVTGDLALGTLVPIGYYSFRVARALRL